jgi:carbon-monoxide dehydrogenase large subunit
VPGSILGTTVVRVEDPNLLEGRATYVDNQRIDGALRLAFVRSTVAHAVLRSVDVGIPPPAPGFPP